MMQDALLPGMHDEAREEIVRVCRAMRAAQRSFYAATPGTGARAEAMALSRRLERQIDKLLALVPDKPSAAYTCTPGTYGLNREGNPVPCTWIIYDGERVLPFRGNAEDCEALLAAWNAGHEWIREYDGVAFVPRVKPWKIAEPTAAEVPHDS